MKKTDFLDTEEESQVLEKLSQVVGSENVLKEIPDPSFNKLEHRHEVYIISTFSN